MLHDDMFDATTPTARRRLHGPSRFAAAYDASFRAGNPEQAHTRFDNPDVAEWSAALEAQARDVLALAFAFGPGPGDEDLARQLEALR